MPKRARPSEPAGATPPHRHQSGGAQGTTQGATSTGGSAAGGAAKLRFKGTRSSHPPAKSTRMSALPLLSLEGSLSEEILLRCLSFLGAHDLVIVARVSSAWHRLSQDPQLWRALYLRTYASPAIRRRASQGETIARTRPWRELYKISTNWRSGIARTSTLGRGLRKAVLPEAPRDLSLRASDAAEYSPAATALARSSPSTAPGASEDADTLLQFHHQFIFSASRSSAPVDEVPSITVHHTLASGNTAVVGSVTSSRLAAFFASRPDFRPPLSITEMRIDESPARTGYDEDGLLLAVFYSTGQFSLFRLAFPSPSAPSRPFSAREVYASLALGTPPAYPFVVAPVTPFDPVTLARLHAPLLVTLSTEMTLRFWQLCERCRGDDEAELELVEAETPLQTRENWAPVVLTLTKDLRRNGRARKEVADHIEERFIVSLAYSAPVFPANWTVGLQEFAVVVPAPSSLPALIRTSKLRVTARHATALPAHASLPSTPRRSAPLASSPLATPPTPQSPVTSIEHSHPFIVTSRTDNTLDVYEVLSPPLATPPLHFSPSSCRLTLDTRSPPAGALRIVHRRTLFGHTARVASVALCPAAGALPAGQGVRCISAGDDGAVKVWSLMPSVAVAGKRAREERVVDVRAEAALESEHDGAEGSTAWQRMKRRRLAGTRGREDAHGAEVRVDEGRQRVRRIWVEEDKIVVAERSREDGAETVRLLRFD
ncbi:hypothetical protein JCM3770_001818 [Rhodotorula araucariae]